MKYISDIFTLQENINSKGKVNEAGELYVGYEYPRSMKTINICIRNRKYTNTF